MAKTIGNSTISSSYRSRSLVARSGLPRQTSTTTGSASQSIAHNLKTTQEPPKQSATSQQAKSQHPMLKAIEMQTSQYKDLPRIYDYGLVSQSRVAQSRHVNARKPEGPALAQLGPFTRARGPKNPRIFSAPTRAFKRVYPGQPLSTPTTKHDTPPTSDKRHLVGDLTLTKLDETIKDTRAKGFHAAHKASNWRRKATLAANAESQARAQFDHHAARHQQARKNWASTLQKHYTKQVMQSLHHTSDLVVDRNKMRDAGFKQIQGISDQEQS